MGWWVPFAAGSCLLEEDKKSENSSSSLNKLLSAGFCDEGGSCDTGVEVVTGEDKVSTAGPGVVGLEADDSGGGMRKGTVPEDVDDVDDIRAIGNDGV